MSAGPRDNYLRLRDVVELTGLPKFALDRLIASGGFVEPKLMGARSPRYSEVAVREWMIDQYDPAVSIEPLPPSKGGRRGFIQEGLLCSQAPEHDGVIRSATKLSRHVVRREDLAMHCTGIYFLWRQGTVVYVGQSRTGFQRVSQHIAQGYKKFDGVSFIRCPAEALDAVERQYIDALLPEYNSDGITLSAKRKRDGARKAIALRRLDRSSCEIGVRL